MHGVKFALNSAGHQTDNATGGMLSQVAGVADNATGGMLSKVAQAADNATGGMSQCGTYDRGVGGACLHQQILRGSFSAVSTKIWTPKY